MATLTYSHLCNHVVSYHRAHYKVNTEVYVLYKEKNKKLRDLIISIIPSINYILNNYMYMYSAIEYRFYRRRRAAAGGH